VGALHKILENKRPMGYIVHLSHLGQNLRNKNIYSLWVGIPMVFNLLEHSSLRGMGPLRVVMTYIPSDAINLTQETRIYMALNGFKDIRTLPV
jgi:hypothetical protein